MDFDRFSLLDEEALSQLLQQNVNPSTAKKLNYVNELFNSWRRTRNLVTNNGIPNVDLVDFAVDELIRWIPLFIGEVRRKDGGKYRAKSLFEFVLCIQSIFCTKETFATVF